MKLDDLPVSYEGKILDDYMDFNGHMNMMWYTDIFNRGTLEFFESHEIGPTYYSQSPKSMMALEQRYRYLAELKSGDLIRIRSRALARSSKTVHFIHFMQKLGSSEPLLAATAEILAVHVDRNERKSAPFPENAAKRFDQSIAASGALDWKPPLSEAISLKK